MNYCRIYKGEGEREWRRAFSNCKKKGGFGSADCLTIYGEAIQATVAAASGHAPRPSSWYRGNEYQTIQNM